MSRGGLKRLAGPIIDSQPDWWPNITYLFALLAGASMETHSWWHWAFWPLLTGAITALYICEGKIRELKSRWPE